MKIAVVGATGMVGRNFLKVLSERNFPIDELYLFASKRSAGQELEFNGKNFRVEELDEHSFDRGIDIALFSAGGGISLKYAPIAAASGCVVVDNSSAWRMKEGVPLVVPEVNPEDVKWHKGIIANPNCSTIQAVVALWPPHRAYGIKRIVYSTYQAVAGAGMGGVRDLEEGLKGGAPKKFPHPIAGNCLPQIDVFLEDGYTKEEEKMINETRKIMHAPELRVTATCVRVPVFFGHSESINAEFEKPFELDELRALLQNSPGIVVRDDPSAGVYPMAIDAAGTNDVYVGRVRRDNSVENGVNLWVVSDSVRKGAAYNAVQIAELLLRR
ncbi:MAG: aspartate-semialdehyde dehydrogenase [Clostridiales bacterium]|jgi:aspartate-semialdehyde dehydrogenase|nr:aspartate-semialdehyde dehydrogenase [Clostridiales bacterium]